MLVDILETSLDQCVSMVQFNFMSMETRRLIRADSPGRPPQLSHSSWTMQPPRFPSHKNLKCWMNASCYSLLCLFCNVADFSSSWGNCLEQRRLSEVSMYVCFAWGLPTPLLHAHLALCHWQSCWQTCIYHISSHTLQSHAFMPVYGFMYYLHKAICLWIVLIVVKQYNLWAI